MKKLLSLSLAAIMCISSIPSVFATADYRTGTKVEYVANNNENYTITVPAKLIPGQSGTVKLEGSWAENRVITVTADKTVTLTNSILSTDQKVLDIYFDGISEQGNNTSAQTFTEPVAVKAIENALFGTWSGKFNYTVSPSDVVIQTVRAKVPEGGKYTATDGTIYNTGDEFPETVTTGDIYEYDGYRYSYNRHVHHSNFGIWETDETQNGWGVMDYDCGTVPSPILESINGKPITDLRYAFAQEDITTAPTIPSTVTNMGHAFYRCSNLTDISKIIIPNGMTNMEHAFQECMALTDASTLIIPNSVTDIYCLFGECSSLTIAPVIPSSILDMGNAFYRCTSLTGSITINTNHINNTNIGKDGSCYSCFSGVDFVAQNITLTGSASKDVLNLIGSTGINWTPIP